MLNIPYVANPGNACALACYTMTAKYFFPETTFEQVAKISDWKPGYIIWPFKFWLWIMDKGIKITDYDLIDLERWASEGINGLKQSTSKEEFSFYLANTENLSIYSADIQKVINHTNFTYYRKKPTFAELESAYRSGAVCETVLNSDILNGKDGFTPHRIVVLDITDDGIVFHDPRKENHKPARKENRKLFEKAWLTMTEPELCVYKKN